MTIHYINKPIFLTLTERNEYEQVVCKDIVSFIHLVRLNIPAILVGGDTKEFNPSYLNYLCWVDPLKTHVPTIFSYVPRDKHVLFYHFTPDEEGYPVNQGYAAINLDSWDFLLETLKTWRYMFLAPKDLDESPIVVKTLKKRRKKGIWNVEATLNGEPFIKGDVEHTVVLDLISRFPRLFAPSNKFKNSSETIFNAEDLPFEVY